MSAPVSLCLRIRKWQALKMIPALPVAELRAQADDLARQIREVDTLVQRTNWEVELLD